jgi:hypothetical protein
MATKGKVGEIISHWSYMLEDIQHSPQDFYAAVQAAVESRNLPNVGMSRVVWKEGGLLSASREYLRVHGRDIFFDVCGAPFGNGFFVSWWMGEPPAGCLATLVRTPIIGEWVQYLAKPITFYRLDTRLMFQSSTHAAVLEVVDQITEIRGVRSLSDAERKPIMREFYKV